MEDNVSTPESEENKSENADVEQAQFDEMSNENNQPDVDDNSLTESDRMEVILDIPVNVSMELGRTKISVRSLLKLSQGSVVELERLAGEPLDVLANGTLIAHGEVVVINEKFGVRLTDVVNPHERMKSLN